jgi:hypothetical protein
MLLTKRSQNFNFNCKKGQNWNARKTEKNLKYQWRRKKQIWKLMAKKGPNRNVDNKKKPKFKWNGTVMHLPLVFPD